MEKQFVSFMQKHNINQYAKVMVGISGGADSLSLLILAKKYFKQVIAVHVNYNLRGLESKEDCEHCIQIAKMYDIPLYVKEVQEHEKKEHHQNFYRKLRYDFFYEIYKKEQVDLLLTAHHKDDQAETVFSHLMKGSGIAGLCGIRPIHEAYGMKILRPLLSVHKKELIDFLEQEGVSYRTDSSNLKTDYQRNKIRLETLPQLNKDFNVNMQESLYKLSELALEMEDMFFAFYQEIKSKLVEDKKIHLSHIQNQYHPAIVKQFIYYFLKKDIGLEHVSNTHILDFLDLNTKKNGAKLSLPNDWMVIKKNNQIIVQKNEYKLQPFEMELILNQENIIPELGITIIPSVVKTTDEDGVYIPTDSEKPVVTVTTYENGAKIRTSPHVRKKVKKLIKEAGLGINDIWYIKLNEEVAYLPQMNFFYHKDSHSHYVKMIFKGGCENG